MNKEYKCPSCGTSDFKVENGYYVCQICGHQTLAENQSSPIKETKPKQLKVEDKGADKLIPLVVFSFLALLELIELIDLFINYRVGWRGEYEYFYMIEGMLLAFFLFDFVCLLSLVGFVGTTTSAMFGKPVTKGVKNGLFVLYVLCHLLSTIFTIIFTIIFTMEFIFVNLLYDAIYIALIWFTTYRFEKWIKNNK